MINETDLLGVSKKRREEVSKEKKKGQLGLAKNPVTLNIRVTGGHVGRKEENQTFEFTGKAFTFVLFLSSFYNAHNFLGRNFYQPTPNASYLRIVEFERCGIPAKPPKEEDGVRGYPSPSKGLENWVAP